MNHTKLKEKQTLWPAKCMDFVFFIFQTQHHHLWLRTHSYYYYLNLIVFFCSCDGVYFGLIFKQHGRPITSLHYLGQTSLEVVLLAKFSSNFLLD